MKLRKSDWALIASVVLYITLLGPFLLSARDSFLVAGGIFTGLGLLQWIVKAVIYHQGKTDNA